MQWYSVDGLSLSVAPNIFFNLLIAAMNELLKKSLFDRTWNAAYDVTGTLVCHPNNLNRAALF